MPSTRKQNSLRSKEKSQQKLSNCEKNSIYHSPSREKIICVSSIFANFIWGHSIINKSSDPRLRRTSWCRPCIASSPASSTRRTRQTTNRWSLRRHHSARTTTASSWTRCMHRSFRRCSPTCRQKNISPQSFPSFSTLTPTGPSIRSCSRNCNYSKNTVKKGCPRRQATPFRNSQH